MKHLPPQKLAWTWKNKKSLKAPSLPSHGLPFPSLSCVCETPQRSPRPHQVHGCGLHRHPSSQSDPLHHMATHASRAFGLSPRLPLHSAATSLHFSHALSPCWHEGLSLQPLLIVSVSSVTSTLSRSLQCLKGSQLKRIVCAALPLTTPRLSTQVVCRRFAVQRTGPWTDSY